MLNFAAVSSEAQKVFGVLQSGNAFKMAGLDNVNQVTAQMKQMSDVFTTIPGMASSALNLSNMATGPMRDMAAHMTQKLSSLPQQLALATSQMSSQLGMGQGNAADPCKDMAGMFGSVMGGANALMGAAQGPIAALAGGMGGGIAGGILGKIGGDLGSLPQAMTNALGPLANPGQLASVMGALDKPENMMRIASTLQNVVAASGGNIASLGSVGSLLGNVGNISKIASSLQSVGGMGASLGGITNALGGIAGGAGGIANAVSGIAGGNVGGIVSAVGGLTGVGGAGAAISSALSGGNLAGAISGAVGNLGGALGGMQGAFAALPGGMGSVAGLVGGLPGGFGGMAAAAFQGGIGKAVGSLGGVMGGVSSMMGGEKAALAGATKSLENAANAINLPMLFSNPCAKQVLDQTATDALKNAAGVGGAGEDGAPDFSDAPPPPPRPSGIDAEVPSSAPYSPPLDSWKSDTISPSYTDISPGASFGISGPWTMHANSFASASQVGSAGQIASEAMGFGEGGSNLNIVPSGAYFTGGSI